MTVRTSAIVAAALVAAFSLSCASLEPAGVEQARADVAAASESGVLDPERSLDYQEAMRHLELAEAALEDGRWQEEADHEAYMASTLASVAQVRAETEALKAVTADALAAARRETQDTQRQVARAAMRARALRAQQTERGLVLTLGGVLFEFDSAELKPEAVLAAARVAGFLIASDDREVVVEGYTDSLGTEEYNLKLSADRAGAVVAALVEHGVAQGRIASAGHGKKYPVADNGTDEGRSKNRRVEVLILEPGQSAQRALRGR